MVGISEKDIESTKALISKNLKLIPEFIIQSDYIAKLIVNGLIMREGFYKNPEVGIINNQNHSVRNIEQYPDYKASVIRLNKILKITTNKT